MSPWTWTPPSSHDLLHVNVKFSELSSIFPRKSVWLILRLIWSQLPKEMKMNSIRNGDDFRGYFGLVVNRASKSWNQASFVKGGTHHLLFQLALSKAQNVWSAITAAKKRSPCLREPPETPRQSPARFACMKEALNETFFFSQKHFLIIWIFL